MGTPKLLFNSITHRYGVRINVRDHWVERTEDKKGKGRRKGQEPTKRLTDRTITDHYTGDTCNKAITRACKQAKVPHWHPNQLRHSVGTGVRENYGVEAVDAVPGHAHLNTTEIYAQTGLAWLRRLPRRLGRVELRT